MEDILGYAYLVAANWLFWVAQLALFIFIKFIHPLFPWGPSMSEHWRERILWGALTICMFFTGYAVWHEQKSLLIKELESERKAHAGTQKELKIEKGKIKSSVAIDPSDVLHVRGESPFEAYSIVKSVGDEPANITNAMFGISVASIQNLKLARRPQDIGPVSDWPLPALLETGQRGRTIHQKGRVLTTAEIEGLENETLGIAVYGTIEFRDMAGRFYSQDFCHFYTGANHALVYGTQIYISNQSKDCAPHLSERRMENVAR